MGAKSGKSPEAKSPTATAAHGNPPARAPNSPKKPGKTWPKTRRFHRLHARRPADAQARAAGMLTAITKIRRIARIDFATYSVTGENLIKSEMGKWRSGF
jgi:hypothetical protein